jgi:two-component system sensor histidine kinase HydH
MEDYMFKSFLNKSLKLQIIFVISLILTVPIAVAVWNIIMPFNITNTVKAMQEERMKNILYYLDGAVNKGEIYNLKDNNGDIKNVEQNLEDKFVPNSKSAKGTRIGIYISANNKNYMFGEYYNGNSLGQLKTTNEEKDNKDLYDYIKQVSATRKDKINYINHNEIEILTYFHPLLYHNQIIAVVWGEEAILPQISFMSLNLIYALILGLIGMILGLIVMVIMVNHLNENITKIRNGLEIMSKDLSYRIEDIDGDLGIVTKSINKMTETLESKERLEEQLARSEKLAALGHMISGVAHEIRNPLGIIRGTVQLMERDFSEVEGLDEYVKIVKEQSDRENKVIQELLDYVRPSKQVLIHMDINHLIEEVLSFTRKYINDNNVKLQLDLQDNLPKLLIDCDKIKQVFVNIIINACEVMENGGTLSISTTTENKWIKIYVEDTGIGMDDNEIKNIFDPYYTTKPRGTGLGLSISNGIIEMHGGGIDVFSKKGQGSTFIVRLSCISSDKGGENGE